MLYRPIAATVFLAFALCGCTGWVVPAVFHAPNKGRPIENFKPSSQALLKVLGVDRELRIPVGPPRAVIRLWVIEPSDSLTSDGLPRATLLQLHGYRNKSIRMLGMARKLARQGFRVVLADMRGHGGSSGDYITYGAVESRDFVRVIDAMEERGLVTGPLGVWGISMGGSTAIQLAALDPRVKAVVAVAPYTTMREVVPHVLHTTVPLFGWMLSDDTIARLVNEGAQIAAFDPDEADTLTAIRRIRIPVLILHGKSDWIVPIEHGRRLSREAPRHAKMVELGWTGHITSHYSDQVAKLSAGWFGEHLQGPSPVKDPTGRTP